MNGIRARTAGIIAAVTGVVLAASCCYVFCIRMQALGFHVPVALVVYVAALLLFAGLCDIIHELAHCIVGRCLKMGATMPKIKPLASSSVTVNPRVSDGIRGRMIATVAAGLISTLILIVLGICALAITSVHPLCIAVLPYAAYSFVCNALPAEYASGKTDGLVLTELISLDDSSRVMLAVLKVQGLINEGTSLKDVDKSLIFDLPQLPEDDINFIVLTQLRYEYFSAVGNVEEAAKYLTRYEEIKQYLPEGYEDK